MISVADVLVLLEAMLETPLFGLTVSDVINNLLDVDLAVDEECLHLAVSTPVLPAELVTRLINRSNSINSHLILC